MFDAWRLRRRAGRASAKATARLRTSPRLDPVDAAATAAIANAMLVRLGEDTDVDLFTDPSGLGLETSVVCMEDFVRHHDRLVSALPDQCAAIGDVLGAQAVRQARATLVVSLTVGSWIAPEIAVATMAAWRSVRSRRVSVREEAVRTLRVFARTTKRRPLAEMRSRTNDAAEVFRLTGVVPVAGSPRGRTAKEG